MYLIVLIMRCIYQHALADFFSPSFPLRCPMAGYLWPNYISDFAISVSGPKGNHSTAQSLRAPYASKLVCHSPFATICCKSSKTSHMTYCSKYKKHTHSHFFGEAWRSPFVSWPKNESTKARKARATLSTKKNRDASRLNVHFERVTHKVFLVVLVRHWGQKRKHCERSCAVGSCRTWSFDLCQVELAPRFLTKVVSEHPRSMG